MDTKEMREIVNPDLETDWIEKLCLSHKTVSFGECTNL